MIKTYIGLHVKYPLFLSDFNETELSRQIFDRYSNIRFYEILSSGSRAVSCGQTDGWMDRQAHMTKLTDDFRNFVNAPKIEPSDS